MTHDHHNQIEPRIHACIIQIFADCSTDNVGISAVWSAHVGFISLGWWRIIVTNHRRATTEGPREEAGGTRQEASINSSTNNISLVTFATALSLVLWVAICAYYAVVEEAITTVAHVVAFAVGAVALLVFEALHGVPSSKDGGEGARGSWTIGSRKQHEYEQLHDD